MSDDPKCLLISIEIVGLPTVRRFLIKNNFDQYWTGTEWSSDRNDGKLYYSVNDTGAAVTEAYDKYFAHLPSVIKYRANFDITVKCKEEIPMDDLKEWLKRAINISIDYPNLGNGPVDDSLVQTTLRLSSIHKIGNESKEQTS